MATSRRKDLKLIKCGTVCQGPFKLYQGQIENSKGQSKNPEFSLAGLGVVCPAKRVSREAEQD